MDRTLVKIYTAKDYIVFRTVSRRAKSPHFYVSRDEFYELEYMPEFIARDCWGFAELRRDADKDTLRIIFTWLHGSGESITGREETVTLRYSEIVDFVWGHGHKDAEYRALSMDCAHRPRLVFTSPQNLHAAVSNKLIRRKLSRALRDYFHWPDAEQIVFYNDPIIPYSFVFHEIRNGQSVMCGGLLLNGQEDMSKACYSLHT